MSAGESDKAAAAATTAGAAADTAAVEVAPAEPADYKNWIEVGAGGNIVRGDEAQFKRQHSTSGDVFGGIQDMHFQQDLGKNGLFTLDGKAIFDTKDYDLKMQLSQTDLGYVSAGFKQYRTWYDSHGGYFPQPGAKIFNDEFEDELAVDRGEVWVELGLRMPDIPEITLRYSHEYRDGQKDSTVWGPTNFTGVANSRLYVPAIRDLDEQRDTFTADISKTYGNTDFDIGMRYEGTKSKDTLYSVRNPGQLAPAASRETRITQRDDVSTDLFSGHGSTVTRFNEYIWLSTGYSYSSLESNVGGDRIWGTKFNAEFNPAGTSPQGTGFINLGGGGTIEQHVVNLNLLWMPVEGLTITPELRIENKEINNEVDYVKTSVSPQPVNRAVHLISANELLNVAEGLEIRYTGINNWVFYARGDWEQEDGSRQDRSNTAYNTAGAPLDLDEDNTLIRQKYTVGANWYPLSRLNFSSQYYHKVDLYSNDILSDDPAATVDNQRMTNLNLVTDDVNFRATWRPVRNVSLVARYDYQYATVSARWKEPGFNYSEVDASEMTNHVYSACITWNPFARWYLQGNSAYVVNKLHTPASDNLSTRIMSDSDNNFITLTFVTGLALDDKTNIRADYNYYRADNYEDNSEFGMPYNSNAEEHAASIGFDRLLSEAVRLSLKYAYYTYHDGASGGYNDYEGHMIYASTQVKF